MDAMDVDLFVKWVLFNTRYARARLRHLDTQTVADLNDSAMVEPDWTWAAHNLRCIRAELQTVIDEMWRRQAALKSVKPK